MFPNIPPLCDLVGDFHLLRQYSSLNHLLTIYITIISPIKNFETNLKYI